MTDEKTLEIDGKTYRRAPETEAQILKVETIGAKQRKIRIQQQRVERQREEAETAGDYTKADELLDRSTELGRELVSAGFEFASIALIDEEGKPPRKGAVNFAQVSDFLGWTSTPNGDGEDPTPTSAT